MEVPSCCYSIYSQVPSIYILQISKSVLVSFNIVYKQINVWFPGKLQWPDRSSATFRSVVGNIDRRIELDASIKREDVRYIPSLAIMAAKLSYESENHVKTVVQRHWMVTIYQHIYVYIYQHNCTLMYIHIYIYISN